MKNLKAIYRIINSVWTIEYKHVTSTEVEIVRYSRDDDEGYDREKELPQGDIIEKHDRTVTGIKVGNQTFTVINPRYIFSYHDAGIINKARSEMEKCPGCGVEYYAGVLAPGKACNDCQIKTAIKPMDVVCNIDLERERIVVWQGNIVIAIVTRNGLIKVINQMYNSPIYLSMGHLDIIQDNFNQMQEMYNTDQEVKERLKKDLTPGV